MAQLFAFLFLVLLLAGSCNLRNEDSRAPASIPKVFDFSFLQGSALQAATEKRLLDSLVVAVSKDKSEITLSMGNYVLLDGKSTKEFACGHYDRVSFIFDADGVAVDGESPELTISSNCEVGENIETLHPVRVPLAKLRAEKPKNGTYSFTQNGKQVEVQFLHSPPDWPKMWILKAVKMSHSKIPGREIAVKSLEDKRRRITMNW